MNTIEEEIDETDKLLNFFKEAGEVGYDFDALWKECTWCAERHVLSRQLQKLRQRQQVERRGAYYFYVDVTAEIKKLLNVPTDPPKPVRVFEAKVQEVAPSSPIQDDTLEWKKQLAPMGELRRGTSITPIVLAFFYGRKYEFSPRDLFDRVDAPHSAVYTAVYRLAKLGYIKVSGGSTHRPRYCWSGQYRYPFPEVRPEDENWKHTHVVKDGTTTVVIDEVKHVVLPANNHLQELDKMIARLTAELEAVKIARDAYAASVHAST